LPEDSNGLYAPNSMYPAKFLSSFCHSWMPACQKAAYLCATSPGRKNSRAIAAKLLNCHWLQCQSE
jgi:hypothetical protein